MTTRILITGGNGNLGRGTAARFEAAGFAVVAFDLPGTAADPARHATIHGDIRDSDLLAHTIDNHAPAMILHLASLLSGSSEADPDTAWEVNATASVRLMRLAKSRGIGPFVFASTLATYGGVQPRHLPEDAPQWPETVYGATKVAVERMGVWMKSAQAFDFRCLRFPMVISPYSPPGAVTAYPGHAVRAALSGHPFTFPVRPDTGVSTLCLDDVTRSLFELAMAPRAALAQHAYNLHGFHFTARQLAEALAARFPDARFDFAPDPQADRLIAGWPDVVDDTGARRDWGWQPQFGFDTALDAIIAQIRADPG